MTFLFILTMLELLEAQLQKAPTLLGVLENLYRYYSQSIFLFFLIHPGFYFILFVVLYTGVLNFTMISIIALKVFDIFYKLELIKKVFYEQRVPKSVGELLVWEIPSWYFILGVVMYPSLLFYALI